MKGWFRPLRVTLIAVLALTQAAHAGPRDVRDDSDFLRASSQSNPELNHILKAFELPKSMEDVPPPPGEGGELEHESDIHISTLASPADMIGVLEETESGFKANVWRYLTEKEAITLFSKLPKTIPPSALRDGLYRLLIAKTSPPRSNEQNWTKVRAAALLQLGAVSTAAQLLSKLPDSALDMRMVPFYAYAMMLGGKQAEACKAVQRLPQDIEPQYQRLQIFCGVVLGNGGKADLALSLREELGIPVPEWFTTVIEHLQTPTSQVTAPEGLLELSDQVIFLYGTDGAAFRKYSADTTPLEQNLQYHGTIAGNNTLQAEDRLKFLESAARYDERIHKMLKDFYDFVVLPESHPAAKRIYAYQALSKSKNVKMALDNLGQAIAQFDTPELLPLANILLREPIQVISQMLKEHKTYPNFAPKAFAILMRSDDFKHTDLWLKLMDRYQPDGVYTYLSYELQRFAKPPKVAYSPSELILPPLPHKGPLDDKERRALTRFYRLMDSIHYQVPDMTLKAQQIALDAGQPQSNLADMISAQSEKGNLPGVVLLALMAQGDKPLSYMDDATAVIISEALQKAGGTALARQFIIDAVLAYF